MKTFFSTFAVVLAGLSLIFAIALGLAYGTPIKDVDDWAREALIKKRAGADAIDQPKIVIVGGSSALMGISGRLIEHVTGRPSINMGLQGSMGMPMMLYEMQRVAKSGDLLIFAPEPHVIWTDELDNAFSASLSMQLTPSHLESLSIPAALEFLRLLPVSRVLDGAFHRFVPPGPPTPGYDIAALNKWGDFTGNNENRRSSLAIVAPDVTDDNSWQAVPEYSCRGRAREQYPKAVRLLADFNQWATARDVELLLTHANRLNHPGARSEETVCGISDQEATYKSLGLKLVGTYSDALFPLNDMFDTHYHLTLDAAKRRTTALVSRICTANPDHCRTGWEKRLLEAIIWHYGVRPVTGIRQ